MSTSHTPKPLGDAVDQLENDYDGFFEFLISPPAQKPGSELGGSLPGLVGTRFHVVGPFRPSLGVATFHNLPLPSRTRFIYPQDDFQSLDAPDWFPSGSHLGLSCEGHLLTIANAGTRS